MDHGSFLHQVNSALTVELAPTAELTLADAARELCAAAAPLTLSPSAKRARPALLYELGRVAGADPQKLIDPAIAIELMHTASLIHDDIVDVATERRDLPSINAALGNAAAVLVGDELLVRAFLRLDSQPQLLHHALFTLRDMVRAAFIEVRARGDVKFPPERWFEMAHGKTAVLFGLCGTFAGLIAADKLRADRLCRAAQHLGVAFQIADDVTDLYTGADLRERNPNLPLSIAAQQAPEICRLAERVFAEATAAASEPATKSALPSMSELISAIVASGAVTECCEAAAREVALARQALGSDLHEGHAPEAIQGVLAWADTLVAAAGSLRPVGKEERAA